MNEKTDKEWLTINAFVQINHLEEDITVLLSRILVKINISMSKSFHISQPLIQGTFSRLVIVRNVFIVSLKIVAHVSNGFGHYQLPHPVLKNGYLLNNFEWETKRKLTYSEVLVSVILNPVSTEGSAK